MVASVLVSKGKRLEEEEARGKLHMDITDELFII